MRAEKIAWTGCGSACCAVFVGWTDYTSGPIKEVTREGAVNTSGRPGVPKVAAVGLASALAGELRLGMSELQECG